MIQNFLLPSMVFSARFGKNHAHGGTDSALIGISIGVNRFYDKKIRAFIDSKGE